MNSVVLHKPVLFGLNVFMYAYLNILKLQNIYVFGSTNGHGFRGTNGTNNNNNNNIK